MVGRWWNDPLRKIVFPILAFVFAAVALMGAQSSAFAMASGWAMNDQGRLRIVSAVDGVGNRSRVLLGLEFRMRPGWKIYWRSPGDAGYPPRVNWAGSSNLGEARISWPPPKRFSIFGIESLGYTEGVVLPLEVDLAEPGKPLVLNAVVSYLTCAKSCVPQDESLTLHLPAAPAKASEQANLLARYTAQVPGDGARQGLAIDSMTLGLAQDEDVRVTIRARAQEPFMNPDLFVEGPEGAFFSRPKVAFTDGGRQATMTVTGGGAPREAFDGFELRVTLVDGARAMEQVARLRLDPDAALPALPPPEPDTTAFGMILLFALLGGLILNLMPCVLPVLSLKLLKVVGHGGADRSAVRAGFLATTAGILFSFMLLATVLAALKGAGMMIGWGIQFQQPVFLAVLTVVLTLFACNLGGFFEVRLPRFLADFATRHGEGSSLTGNFMTGAFVTVLATPCSAPFLGTAVGFALGRGPLEIYTVLFALGLGLALPYIVVAIFPVLATSLPKPGPWMVVLRRVLALALAATAVWLLSIINSLMGMETAIAIGALMALAAVVLAAVRRIDGLRLARYSGAVVTLLLVAAVAIPVLRPPAALPALTASTDWEPFDEAAIVRLVKQGRTVLVDVTAEWCITCRVNKMTVLEAGVVNELLDDGKVVPMQADWTRPNPVIANYLARHGRYGIPFNIVYGPKAPQGIMLPELLTKGSVLGAFVEASGDTAIATRK
jgi:suppressor for copper-sensitivity B